MRSCAVGPPRPGDAAAHADVAPHADAREIRRDDALGCPDVEVVALLVLGRAGRRGLGGAAAHLDDEVGQHEDEGDRRDPLEDAEDPEDLRLIHPAVYMSEEDIDYTVKEIEYLYENTDKAIVLLFAGQLVEQAQRDFGFEPFYCNMAIEKDLMHSYFRMITDIYMKNLRRILERAGDKIDVVWFCDDIGTQQTLQFSIPMYREMIKPYASEMWGYIHENYPDIRVLYHSCGAIFDLIPDLIEAGVDLLNPVQISAKGMDPQKLKDTYGKQLMFWGGGTDTQSLANLTDLDAVRDNARHLLEIFAKNGNYVFTQVHNFQADVPPEKILAIFETAKQYREELEAGQ